MKRILSFILALSFIFAPVSAQAAGNNFYPVNDSNFQPENDAGHDGGLRDWFFIDPVEGVELSGANALRELQKIESLSGESMDEALLAVEEDALSGDENTPPVFYSDNLINGTMNMSVYDIPDINFTEGEGIDKNHTTIATVTSVYQAAQYVMYCLMNGSVEAVMTLDKDIPRSYAGRVIGQLTYFVQAYFPHYFWLSATSQAVEINGVEYIDTITVKVVACTYDGYAKEDYSKWQAEYDEVERLVTAGNIKLLKEAHDYLVESVKYNLKACNKGQLAYCALIEKQAVCNGYALATSMLALRLDANVTYISGSAGGPHAWNLNLGEGSYNGSIESIYMVDTTWANYSNGTVHTSYYNVNLAAQRRIYSSIYYFSYIAYVNNKLEHVKPDLIFANMADAIRTFTVQSLTDGDTSSIDLLNETINIASLTSLKEYSIDGGVKWKTVKKTDIFTDAKKAAKFFNKEMTLHLRYNNDAEVKFPKINARPKTKIKPFYLSEGTWIFIDSKDKSASPTSINGVKKDDPKYEGYEFAVTDNKARAPAYGWEELPESGIDILSGKDKVTYLVRRATTAIVSGESPQYTPAGKQFKVKPANYGKAPNYADKYGKIKEKNGILSLKKGETYSLGTNNDFVAALAVKTDLKLAELGYDTIFIKKAATGKKPDSEVLMINISSYTGASNTDITATGSVTSGSKLIITLTGGKFKTPLNLGTDFEFGGADKNIFEDAEAAGTTSEITITLAAGKTFPNDGLTVKIKGSAYTKDGTAAVTAAIKSE